MKRDDGLVKLSEMYASAMNAGRSSNDSVTAEEVARNMRENVLSDVELERTMMANLVSLVTSRDFEKIASMAEFLGVQSGVKFGLCEAAVHIWNTEIAKALATRHEMKIVDRETGEELKVPRLRDIAHALELGLYGFEKES